MTVFLLISDDKFVIFHEGKARLYMKIIIISYFWLLLLWDTKMEGKENITEYRDKLDKTLKSDDLCNVEFLKKLVENQLSKSSQHEDQGLYS